MQLGIFRKEIVLVVFVLTAVFGTIYMVVQQANRQGANDPQLGLAQDIASALGQNNQPSVFESATKVDMDKSLSPFLIITDESGKTVVTTGQIGTNSPTPPKGVFDAAKKSGQNRVTWQPQKGVRIALVVIPYNHGFVAVGRSLKEIEDRDGSLMKKIAIAWVLTVFGSIVIMGVRRK